MRSARSLTGWGRSAGSECRHRVSIVAAGSRHTPKTKSAKKSSSPGAKKLSRPAANPSKAGGARRPGAKENSTPGPRPEVQKAAGLATRRASQFAQARLQELMAGGGPEERMAGMRPYVEVVVEALEKTNAGKDSTNNDNKTRSRGAKKGAMRDLLDSYSEVFSMALDLELREEWSESEERLASWSKARLEQEGFAMFGLSASMDSKLLRDTIIRMYVPGQPLPFNCLSQGDIVLLSANGATPGDDSQEAVVLDYSTRWIRVAVPEDAAAGIVGGGWRMDMFANTTAYERSHLAVKQFSMPLGNEPSGEADLFREGSKDLIRMLAGTIPSGKSLPEMAATMPSWLRGRDGKERISKLRSTLSQLLESEAGQLNDSQVEAVQSTLLRSLTLWQGPPGTGKTRTLLRFVKAAVSAMPKSSQVLATAASNVAVDNLVSGLLALDVKVVRVGQPAKVSPELRAFTLEALIAKTADGQTASGLRKKASEMQGSQSFGLIQQAMQLEERAAQEVLSQSEVVACTCIGAGDPRLLERSFPLCVVDEACQATEPTALVAIMNQVQALLLVGDPQQLPPTVQSPDAATLGLGVSLFSRLMRMGMEPMLLDTQYRMHPSICDFPSQAFYGGRLKSFPKPIDRPLPQGIYWPNQKVSVCMVAVQGEEQRTSSSFATPSAAPSVETASTGFSYLNDAEAQEVVAVVMALLQPAQGGAGLQASQIGVITPYNGQVRHIQSSFQKKLFWDRSLLKEVTETLEIKSVDGFQGREKEVIIFSAVRSNNRGSVGFLADFRRLNVAITRAKRGLVILGNPATLKADKTWSTWLKWALDNKIIMRPPPRAEPAVDTGRSKSGAAAKKLVRPRA